MLKKDLVKNVGTKLNVTQKVAEEAIDAVMSAVLEGMKADGKVSIANFGVFETKERPARDYNNPITGETVSKPAMTVPKFRFLPSAKEYIAG